MEIVWRNSKIAVGSEGSVFSIGYIDEPHRVRVYYLSSFGPEHPGQQYELLVNRKRRIFHGEYLNLSATASVGRSSGTRNAREERSTDFGGRRIEALSQPLTISSGVARFGEDRRWK